MTLDELRANEALRRHEFPVVADRVFLAHAGVCPLPRRVADAMGRYVANCQQGDQEDVLPNRQIPRTRELAARLLGAKPDEIALVGPTSLALSFVAAGLAFSPGDNVVAYFDDYPSNVYPWAALAEKQVETRFLQTPALGVIGPAEVLEKVDERTRLVALASCHFVAGYRIDIAGIGEELKRRGILFCVDGIQTLGAFPTPIGAVDFLAADAHKWLLGPCAAGILFVREEMQSRLAPMALGWNNVVCPDFVAQAPMALRRGGRRYEPGTHNLVGLVGLEAALELILEIGVAEIGRELARQRAWLVPALRAKGWSVLQGDAPPERTGGITSFYRPGVGVAAWHQKLRDAGVIVSARADRSGQQYLRISPHFYNTDAELRRALELV